MKTLKSATALLLNVVLVSCAMLPSLRTERYANVYVQFVSPTVGWIFGPRLLQTTDGGKNWTVLQNEGTSTFRLEDISLGRNRIHFADSKLGWILGDSAINKTVDGGNTWSVQLVVKGGKGGLGALFFLSPDRGWAVGDDVYGTIDGGLTWQLLGPTPPGNVEDQTRLHVSASAAVRDPTIWFTSPIHGFMARWDGLLFETIDGGQTWKENLRVKRRFESMYFVNDRLGWISDSFGGIMRTDDGGKTWKAIQVCSQRLNALFFLNENLGWAVGDEGTIVLTKDGGISWKKAAVSGIGEYPPPFASVSFSDPLHGWAVGGLSDPITSEQRRVLSNIVVATEDGGESWHIVEPF